ncbi:MAG: C45 family peptidase [Bacteroidales bacterium]|nr:C45 family peptidase [Bacteroidales bacterium]
MTKVKPKKNRRWRRLRNTFIVIAIAFVFFALYYHFATRLSPPVIPDQSALSWKRENPSPDFYRVGNNWLKKNNYGLWEMYLEGSPFEMGVANGKLTKELIAQQEAAFVDQINTLIPSPAYLKFLKYFTGWFNRDIDKYIPEEYKEEIYGVSVSAADGYEYIGDNYDRMLNYHAAHDIGHALQSLMLVGCTSFGANFNSTDSSLIIGRNFDFFINPAFAENKIVVFVHPDQGIDFMYVSWASMIGVVSGMNAKGLTVTINAAKSDIPTSAKTPISILAREILQHAGNIKEALTIAEKRQTFVAESLLIGSAEDNKAIIIEKSPKKLGVFEVNDNHLVCANHFQSDTFSLDENNERYKTESATVYRQQRCEQLMQQAGFIDAPVAASILRDHLGLDGKNIGIGNEKTMAQMISHHSVIFEPKKQIGWVSTQSYQLGDYLGYHLDEVFAEGKTYQGDASLYDSVLTIAADSFLVSSEFADFLKFRDQREAVKQWIKNKTPKPEHELLHFVSLNSEYYQGYVLTANYYYVMGDTARARQNYQTALTKELENTGTAEMIKARLEELKEKKN